MPLSDLAESGTAVMGLLAKSPKKSHTAETIAKEAKLSPKVVSKILKMLTFSGLLLAGRGGYRLKEDPDKIYVADIIAALDKPASRATHSQFSKAGALPLATPPTTRPIIYQSRFAKLTLADILRPEPNMGHPTDTPPSQPVVNGKGGPKHH